MTKYQNYFKRTLQEADFRNMQQSPDADAIQYDDNLSPEAMDQFNVDPMDPNVGFEQTNVTEDVKTLKGLIEHVEKISKDMESISQKIVSLERSFNGITAVSATIGRLYETLHDVSGELGKYIITLPAEELKRNKETENAGQ